VKNRIIYHATAVHDKYFRYRYRAIASKNRFYPNQFHGDCGDILFLLAWGMIGQKKVTRTVNAVVPDLIELVTKLVAIPSITDQPNVEIIEFIATYLNELQFHVVITEGRTHKNLVAKNRSALACDRNGIPYFGLCGHVDTVPYDQALWETDPFVLTEKAGNLYGLGAGDMKGAIACMIAALQRCAGQPADVPAALVLTHTEEQGLEGARELIASGTSSKGLQHIRFIIGEPTCLHLCFAHKGYSGFHVEIYGQSAHSSRPGEGLNAIYAASRFNLGIARFNDELINLPYPPFDYGPTANVGEFKSGDITNRVADKAVIRGDFRYFKKEDHARFQTFVNDGFKELQREGYRCHYTPILESPPFSMDPESGLIGELAALLEMEPATLPYTTDASVFNGIAGLPCAILGPGTIDVCHQPNEHICMTDLHRAVELYTKILMSQAL